jgi:hypothetical protein
MYKSHKVEQALCKLVHYVNSRPEYKGYYTDFPILRNLLNDFVPNQNRNDTNSIDFIIKTAKEDIPQCLLAKNIKDTHETAKTIASKYHNEPEVILWAIHTWALALNISLNDEKTPTKKVGIHKKTIVVSLACIIILLTVMLLYYFLYPYTKGNDSDNVLYINPRTSFQLFCKKLQEAKIVKNWQLYYYLNKFSYPEIYPGEYRIPIGLSFHNFRRFLLSHHPDNDSLPTSNPSLYINHNEKYLSGDAVKDLIRRNGYFCAFSRYSTKWYNEDGRYTSKSMEIINSRVVFDHAQGLLWMRGGSDFALYWTGVDAYVRSVNRSKFIGHTNWRLPNLNEAMSLMRYKKANGSHVDSRFGIRQTSIWTSDSFGDDKKWVVQYDKGRCNEGCYKYKRYVRLVCDAEKNLLIE